MSLHVLHVGKVGGQSWGLNDLLYHAVHAWPNETRPVFVSVRQPTIADSWDMKVLVGGGETSLTLNLGIACRFANIERDLVEV